MKCNIQNNSNMNMQDLSPLIDDLASAIQQKVGFKSMPSITLQDDEDNADVLLGKTAYYDPQNKAVTVYVTNRHPKDILRSIAHELIHHGQNLRGEFDKIGAVGEGYAQNDEHLRNMEKEAYLKGNMCFRDWEDGYKRQMMESIHRQNSFKRRSTKMRKYKTNKNNELNKLLMEKFNFGGKKKEYDLEEGADRIFAPNHYCAHHVVHEGQEAYTVDHNWDEQLQEVTEYDIRFRDGTVKRDVPVAQLEILQAFNESEHGNRDENGEEDESKHPAVKSAKKKKVEELENPEKADLDKDGELSGYEKNRAEKIEKSMKDQAKKKGKKGKVEEMDRSAENKSFEDPEGAADQYRNRKKKDKKEKVEESELPDLPDIFNVTRRRGRGSKGKSKESELPDIFNATRSDRSRLRKTVDGRMVPISHYPEVPLDAPLGSMFAPISKEEALKLKAQGYDITDEEIAMLDISVNESFRREVRKLMEEVLKLK